MNKDKTFLKKLKTGLNDQTEKKKRKNKNRILMNENS